MKEANEQEFIVTARKWRPLRFDSVIGQDHITGTLKNALKSARLHHAYLFCGPRGVGKTTTARILARAVNCLNPQNYEPCNECVNCTSMMAGRSIDIIEIDGASNNSVDDIRKLRENSKYAPSLGKYKMYIIDEVHMLSTSAFNALLKTLEEPPPHLLFVFATTESHKVPATIISRCQRFDFRRMEIEDIVNQIKYIAEKENIAIDEESLVTIAKKGDGSMRDAQSIFDQVIAFCGTDIKYTQMASALHLIDEEFFFSLTDAIAEKDTNRVFALSQEVISRGYELQETLQGLLEHYRNILSVVVTKDTKLIKTSSYFIKKYIETANKFTKANILRYLQIINTTEQAIKFMPQPRIRFELALVSMAEMDNAMEIKELIEELRQIKAGNYLTPAPQNNSNQNSLNQNNSNQIDTKVSAAPAAIAATKDKSQPTQNEPIRPANEMKITASSPKAIPVASAGANEISADQIKQGYRKMLSGLLKFDASFSPMYEFVTAFLPNEIVLKSDNKFVIENIEKKRKQLVDFVNDFYKSRIKLTILEVKPADNSHNSNELDNNKENLSNSSNNFADDENLPSSDIRENEMPTIGGNSDFQAQNREGKHSVELKLMDLLNAVELK